MRGSLDKRKYFKYAIVLIVVLAAAAIIRSVLVSGDTSIDQSQEKTTLDAPVANKELQKEISVKLVDEAGKEIGGVLMRLENVEMRDEIIVRGQKFNSVPGRTFLVINMKLVNSLTQAVEINTKDYLRLGVSENEWLAPDIHNDPVTVQAISTKPTRVAFPVDSNLRRFSLQLGEISGEKEVLEIDFTQQ